MQTVSISQASRNLSHWINRASYGQEYVVLTSRGKPKAILVGIEAFAQLVAAQQVSQDPGVRSRQALLNDSSPDTAYRASGQATEIQDESDVVGLPDDGALQELLSALQQSFGVWRSRDDVDADSARAIRKLRDEWAQREGRLGHG